MNSRRSMRFPPSDDHNLVTLSDGREECPAIIVDESYGGVAIACEAAPSWDVGTAVQVLYWNVWETAVIRRRDRRDTKTVFGLEWESGRESRQIPVHIEVGKS